MSRPTSNPTEALWHELSDRLRRFFRKRVADEHTAEDLLQETFVRIQRSLNSSTTQRIVPWVFRIARNLLVDHYRTHGKPIQYPQAETAASNNEETNLNREVASWIGPMIQSLPEDYRIAVKRYELEGRPQQAIADELGLSLSGAKSRIQRGRRMLKSRLLDCCQFERDRYGNIVEVTQKSQDSCDCD